MKDKAKELLKDKKVIAALSTLAVALAGLISPEFRTFIVTVLGALGT